MLSIDRQGARISSRDDDIHDVKSKLTPYGAKKNNEKKVTEHVSFSAARIARVQLSVVVTTKGPTISAPF